MSNLHNRKGRERKVVKSDKMRNHDKLVKNVCEKALEEFKRLAYGKVVRYEELHRL
jgi:hypothetical protein